MSSGDEPTIMQWFVDLIIGVVMSLLAIVYRNQDKRIDTLEKDAKDNLRNVNEKIDASKSDLMEHITRQHNALSGQILEVIKLIKDK